MEIHFHINLQRPEWTRNWSQRRQVIVSLALALVLIPTALNAASDIFSDVPDGHIFHDDINAIYGARITTGTTPTTYSPEDFVTRGQMAAFLHRSLGRIAYDTSDNAVNLGAGVVDLAVITLNTGGVSGGMGFVKLDGVATSRTETNSTTGCPCGFRIWITQDGGSISRTNSTTLYNGSSGVRGAVTDAVTWALSVPTNTTQTFRLRADFVDSAGAIPANLTFGELTAIYAPFGSGAAGALSSEEVSEVTIPNRQ